MTCLALAGELTINEAATHRDTLLAWLAEDTADGMLDLSAIEACDSAGVQLLLALRRSLAARGRTLQLGAAPEAVTSTLATYGLTPALLLERRG